MTRKKDDIKSVLKDHIKTKDEKKILLRTIEAELVLFTREEPSKLMVREVKLCTDFKMVGKWCNSFYTGYIPLTHIIRMSQRKSSKIFQHVKEQHKSPLTLKIKLHHHN